MLTPRPNNLPDLEYQLWRYGEHRAVFSHQNRLWRVFSDHLQAKYPPGVKPRTEDSDAPWNFRGVVRFFRDISDREKTDILVALHKQVGTPNEERVFGADGTPLIYPKNE